MNLIERFSGVFLIAGLLLFVFAFVTLAVLPVAMVEKMSPFAGLPDKVPPQFSGDYPDTAAYHAALIKGRDVYVAEACWHCHSQYVRPVSNESLFYGPVSTAGEYQNILNRPQLFGTRRVGPDLSREAGQHSNDWHYAHLYQPTNVVPRSVMPSYSWYFDIVDGVPVPREEAKALVAYLQWLGHDVADRREGPYDFNEPSMPPSE